MPKPKILIIEDEAAILRALSRVFEGEGFTTVTATNGAQGLSTALREKPDLIILDIVMPGMNGMTMLGELRKENEAWCKVVPVVAYTNLNYHEVRDEARDLNITKYLIKSDVALGELIDEVKRILRLGVARR